jgi:hypothetical protein
MRFLIFKWNMKIQMIFSYILKCLQNEYKTTNKTFRKKLSEKTKKMDKLMMKNIFMIYHMSIVFLVKLKWETTLLF